MTEASTEGAGLYVHVPFCLTRCGYCDFNTYAGLDHLRGRYVEALRHELDLSAPEWAEDRFVSVFFGGGTPTLLPSLEIVGLLGRFAGKLRFDAGCEITVEANPDTVEEWSLAELRLGGVTRLSLGVQSFDPVVLEALERIHSPESARRALAAARHAGFDNLNLDLIYGADGETMESWGSTLAQAVDLGPEHVSAYALTIEPATGLGRKVAAGLVPPPDADFQAEMYDVACTVLGAAGYEHYEVSNWASPGLRCRHNLGYWDGRPYLGLGAGAHSYRTGRRWWNVRPPQQYLEMVEAGIHPVGGEERLSDDQRKLERLLLGLRTVDGVPTSWLDGARAEGFVTEGLAARRAGGRIGLTERGMLLANELVLEMAG